MEAYTFQAPSGRTRRREKSCSQQRMPQPRPGSGR